MVLPTKRILSGSTDGMGIKITQTGTAGDTIHTAVAGTTPGTYDEIWIWAQNNHTSAVTLTIEFGDANAEHNIIVSLASKSGLIPIVPGLILQNGKTVKAFASSANVITLTGFVNSMVTG